jgi:hypothetical protein
MRVLLWRRQVTVSFLEVYNESIRDLLADGPTTTSNTPATPLELREDLYKGNFVLGLKEVRARREKSERVR